MRKTDPNAEYQGQDAKKIEKVRSRCEKSIFWTAWYICGFRDLSFVLHFAISSWFTKWLDQGHRWFLLLIPRGHFKTSLMNQAFIVHTLIKDPNKTILLVMHNLDEAKKKGRMIRYILMSEAMRTYFPELVPESMTKLGTQTEFSVIRTRERSESSVTLAGVATGLVGGHYDIIIIDDGIDFKATNSEAVMTNAVDFFEAIPPLFENENAIVLVIGTLWPGGDKGFYEKLLANPLFKKVVLGCYIDDRLGEFLAEVNMKLPELDGDYTQERVKKQNLEIAWKEGSPIFPERRTMKTLAQDLAIMGSYKFSHQMLNTLISEGQQLFFREDFLEYSQIWRAGSKNPRAMSLDGVIYPWSHGFKTVAMDPTGGIHKDSDTCGITSWWWHQRQRFGCMYKWFEESGLRPKDQLVKFYDMAVEIDADLMIIESGAMQVWAEEWLKVLFVERGRSFRLVPFKTRGIAKGRRILDRVQPYAANHQLYVLQPEHQHFVDHMVKLNISVFGEVAGQSPALADTMPMHCEWWQPGREKDVAQLGIVREEDEAENARKAKRTDVRYGLSRRTGRKFRYG